MKRKSVSYLTSIRLEVAKTLRETYELALDLEIAIDNILELTPEQIRCDIAGYHTEHVAIIKKLHRQLGKAIKNHDAESKKLKSFF